MQELPNNIDAEKAVLGSVLMRADAIHEVIDMLQPHMFYMERHAIIYRAMEACAARRVPCDTRTVSNELRKASELESIGGVVYLSDLTDSVPTSQRIAYYADIVRKTAGFRALIDVGGKIAALGYNERESLETAQAKAEKALLDATAGTASDDLTHISAVVNDLYEDFDPSNDNAGVYTGFYDFDEITGGLHGGDFIVLAARPSVGKTSLALCLASNLALANHNVQLYSLEMSKKQNVQRLISMGTGIPLEMFRDRKLGESETRRSFEYMGDVLNKAPLYINDTGSLPIQSLRAKALRNSMQYGKPTIIIVDYLQLLADPSYKNDRVQEVGSVSRQLKALARELDCTVLALAQLSRAVESRQSKIPILSDLRECVTGETLLVNAENGIPVAIKNVAKGMHVMGVNRDQKIAPYEVRDVWSNGERPVYQVKTSTGKYIKLTAEHPLMTASGWKPVSELSIGDTIATAMQIPAIAAHPDTSADLCRLIGYMVGNGTYLKNRSIGLIVSDMVVFNDVSEIMRKYFPNITLRIKRQTDKYIDFDFVQLYANGYGKPYGNDLREWFRDLGMFGARDSVKHVPEYVFQSGVIGITSFLSGYLNTDGCVKNGKNGWRVHFDTTSIQLARDIQLLLSYIGVAASVDNGSLPKNAKRVIYRVTLSSFHFNLLRFGNFVPVIGRKGALIEQMRETMPKNITSAGVFGLPVEVSQYVASKSKWRDQGKTMRRDVCMKWAESLSDNLLRIFAESDLLWEKIASIEYMGYQEVFDISIPGCANFIGNGILTHNCGQIEQDADIVAFIHREELHDKETDKKGIAELHIAKHRNGALGVIPMRFDGITTKFDNLQQYRGMDGY